MQPSTDLQAINRQQDYLHAMGICRWLRVSPWLMRRCRLSGSVILSGLSRVYPVPLHRQRLTLPHL